jgi:hypothetical protein
VTCQALQSTAMCVQNALASESPVYHAAEPGVRVSTGPWLRPAYHSLICGPRRITGIEARGVMPS